MFGLGFTELIVIVVIALLAIKPEKLPEVAKSVGSIFSELKRAGDDIKKSITDDPNVIKGADTPVTSVSSTPAPPTPPADWGAESAKEDLKRDET
ncbi:MAG: twin-arginine translocase TatA/TatE family subunit [Thermodesulfobacteriota bacterium]